MKKIIEYMLIFLLSTVLFMKGIVPGWTIVNSDFANYYVSAQLIMNGTPLEHLYDNDWFQEKIREAGISTPGKFAPFPPITAWMMVPLAGFSPLHAQQLFTLLNLACLGWGVFLLRRLSGWPMSQTLLLILAGGLSIVNNFAFGQVYWIITVIILASIILFQHGHPMKAGILLGILTAIKYFPLVFIGGLFLLSCSEGVFGIPKINSPAFKTSLAAMATLAILIIFQFLFFGNVLMQTFFVTAFLPHLDGELAGQGLYSFQFQSWDGLFRHLFVEDPQFNVTPLIAWIPGKAIGKSIVVLVVIGTLLWTLFRFRTATFPFRRAVFLSMPALAALTVLPASATYHFSLLLIPVILLLGAPALSEKSRWYLIALYVLIGFIPYQYFFSAASFAGVWLAYPRLWLMTMAYGTVLYGLHQHRANAFSHE